MSNDDLTGYVSRPDDERALCLELGLAIPERVMSLDVHVRPHDLVTATVVLQVPASVAKRLFSSSGPRPGLDETVAMNLTDEDARHIQERLLAVQPGNAFTVEFPRVPGAQGGQ